MKIDFTKYTDGLVPAIVQDHATKKVLMMGFMNQEAVDQTKSLGKVTFYSRSKNRLWTKGEESGNFSMGILGRVRSILSIVREPRAVE